MFTLILSVFIISVSTVCINADTSDEVNSYFEILEKANSIIVSGKGSYSYTQIMDENEYARARAMLNKTNNNSLLPHEPKLILNKYFTYAFDGPKYVSYEFNNKEHEFMLKKTIYNCEIRKQIAYSFDSKGLLSAKGIVTSKQIGDPAVVNPFFLSTDFFSIILNLYKNGRFKTVLFNKINYNGMACDVITLEDVENIRKFVLWVSPELGYNFVKIEITTMAKKHNKEIFIEYVKYKDYYIPHKIVREHYNDGEFASKHIITIEDDWEFNIDIKSEDFTLDFPSGIRVFDQRIKDSYIIE